MGFLIDTNLWIAVERGKISAADIHAVTRQEPVCLSPVNLAEIRFGIELMIDPKLKQRAVAALRRMRRKPLLRITGETGEVFGTLAAQLERDGRGGDFRVQDLGWPHRRCSAASRCSRRMEKISRTCRD